MIGNEEKYIFQKFSSYPFIRNNPLIDIIAVKYIAGIIDEKSKKTMYDFPVYNLSVNFAPISPAGKTKDAILATVDCNNIITSIDGKTIFPVFI
ncbi:MAG: hypothetical protein SOU16_00185 [Faecalimonas sp.]|nr:hypothetical protein [Faecalimonas sp.]